MSSNQALSDLSDPEIARVLQHLAGELLPPDSTLNPVGDPEAGTAVLRELLAQTGGADIAPINPSALSRAAAEIALADKSTREPAEDLIADPPQIDQMGAVNIGEHAAVLYFLIAFLQTHFSVRVSRAGGKTEASVEVGKDALPPELLAKVLSVARALVPGSDHEA